MPAGAFAFRQNPPHIALSIARPWRFIGILIPNISTHLRLESGHILDGPARFREAVKGEYGVALVITTQTQWRNIDEALKSELAAVMDRSASA
jgi:hypothetical protein